MSRYRRSLATGATFFFTVNLADRKRNLLGDEIARLRDAYRQIGARHSFETVAICVLADHIHAIWRLIWHLPDGDADFGRRSGAIKRFFSSGLAATETQSPSKLAKREKAIWPRRFWEHQIRNDNDLQRHIDYTYFNPVKHVYVKNVADWPHSSLHRDVKRGLIAPEWAGVEEARSGSFGE